MSRDYFVHCATCRQTLDYPSPSYNRHVPHTLIRHARALAAMAPLMEAAQGWLRLGSDYERIRCDWFAEHADHELVVMDEYDQVDDRCGKTYECDRCLRGYQHCNLQKGHEGRCSGRLS